MQCKRGEKCQILVPFSTFTDSMILFSASNFVTIAILEIKNLGIAANRIMVIVPKLPNTDIMELG